jgi:starvation-inducible DNA-binding protein
MTTTFNTRVHLEASARAQLVDMLNQALAETTDLYLKTKQAHWNVRGPFFFARHELFDKLANTRREHADMLAERAGAMGGYAEGSLRWAAENSKLGEYDRAAVGGREHLAALIDAYADYARHVRTWIGRSGELDPGTEDAFTEVLRAVELDLWFLESHVQA